MLRLRLLGIPNAFRSTSQNAMPMHRQSLLFLAYLAVGRNGCVPRDKMAEDLWPDASGLDSRHQLSAALFRVRQTIEPAGRDLISCGPSGELRLDVRRVSVDVGEFREQTMSAIAGDGKAPPNAEALCKALEIYQGRFLDGISAGWVLMERDNLSRLYVRGLTELLASRQSSGRIEDALECGLRALKEDPFKESVLRDVMRIYMEKGEPAEARRVFAAFSLRLADELEIAPALETIALNRELAGGAR